IISTHRNRNPATHRTHQRRCHSVANGSGASVSTHFLRQRHLTRPKPDLELRESGQCPSHLARSPIGTPCARPTGPPAVGEQARRETALTKPRKLVWIDRFQTHLFVRIGVYCVIFQATIWLLLFIGLQLQSGVVSLLGSAGPRMFYTIALGVAVLL